MRYTIRTEQPRDFKTVENLTREAFWNVYRPGCTEHYVLHCYRSEPDFVAMRNPEAFEKYDSEFPPKEKLVLPIQL